jgi:hypothetical protein
VRACPVRRGPRPAHAPLSRPRTDCRIHPSLHSSSHRYGLVRGHQHTDPVLIGVLRRAWTCAQTATSTHPRARLPQARWHSFDAKRACISWRRSMHTIYTRGSPCFPTIPPAAAYFPSLAALLPPSRASALHASQEAHSVIDTSTLFHFRCAMQLSSAPRLRAQFSVLGRRRGTRAGRIWILTR